MSEASPHPDPDAARAAQQELRRRAEARAETSPHEEPSHHVLHELRVHQIELEMQNEELRRAQVDLEASRARYFALYEQAPIGYCTLDPVGIVREANLTAANLFGVTKDRLLGRALTEFLHPDSQDVLYLNRRTLQDSLTPQAFELRFLRGADKSFWAWVEMHMTRSAGGAMECQVAFTDISLLKQSSPEAPGQQD